MDPHSQYCSWLITVAETFVISLKFSILTIPQCNDAFLFIHNGPNDTSPVLGKYCGENATAGMEIRSSTNYLLIVGNSGSNESYGRSVFRFQAQYIAHYLSKGLFSYKTNVCHTIGFSRKLNPRELPACCSFESLCFFSL